MANDDSKKDSSKLKPIYPADVRPPRGPDPNRAAEESRRVCQAAVDRKPGVYSEKLVRLQTADSD